MADRSGTILKGSKDGREIKKEAIAFAASPSPDDHRLLLECLSSSEFLSRLDPPESYEGTYRDLRLGRVIRTLADNREPSAEAVLVALVDSGDFQADALRMQILLRALAVVRPSPPKVVAYWNRLSAPQSPIAGDVIETLCENQSPPALELLEKKLSAPAQDRDNRILWMRYFVLARRNDEPLLLCCERMLTESLPADLRPPLVEVLFDYRPDEWFMPEDPPKPPPREQASEKAREILRRIGAYVLEAIELTLTQRQAVARTLRALGGDEGKDA